MGGAGGRRSGDGGSWHGQIWGGASQGRRGRPARVAEILPVTAMVSRGRMQWLSAARWCTWQQEETPRRARERPIQLGQNATPLFGVPVEPDCGLL
jgi:hypothetical protein